MPRDGRRWWETSSPFCSGYIWIITPESCATSRADGGEICQGTTQVGTRGEVTGETGSIKIVKMNTKWRWHYLCSHWRRLAGWLAAWTRDVVGRCLPTCERESNLKSQKPRLGIIMALGIRSLVLLSWSSLTLCLSNPIYGMTSGG